MSRRHQRPHHQQIKLVAGLIVSGLLLAGCNSGSSSPVVEPGDGGVETPEPPSTLAITIQAEPIIAGGSRQSLRAGPDPADGTITWQWQLPTGSPTLEDVAIDGSRYSFTAPVVSAFASLEVRVDAVNSSGDQGSATTRIEIYPKDSPAQQPTVSAGEDRVVNEADTISLYGQAMARNGRSIRRLSWIQTAGPEAGVLGGLDKNQLRITLPQIESEQTLRWRFSAEDSGGFESSDELTLTLLNNLPNQLPRVDAGTDQAVLGRERVTVSGLGSDADGSIASYRWQALAPYQTLEIDNADKPVATFTAPNVAAATALMLRLTATDNEGASGYDDVSISVSPGANASPQILSAEATPDLVYDSEWVGLTVQATDDDGDQLSYQWVQRDNGAPVLGVADANSREAAVVIPEVDEATQFQFQVTVNDGRASSTDTVNIDAVPRDDWTPSTSECLENPLRKGCALYPVASLLEGDYYTNCASNPLSEQCFLGDLLGNELVSCLQGLSADNCVNALLSLTDPSYILEQIGPDEPADTCNPAFDRRTFAHYRGSLHEHTGYSDGTVLTRPADVFARVKAQGFDFAASSDHSDTLQIPLSVGRGECPPEKLFYCYLIADEENPQDAFVKWAATLAQSEAASVANEFTALRGFEWTSDRFGHANVYFSSHFLNAKTGPGYAVSMALFWEWFTLPTRLGGGADGLLSFNHPGREDAIEAVLSELGIGDPAFTFNDFRYVSSADYRVVGIEVFGKGSEYDSGGPGGSWFSYALDKGWHLAPIGSEDHHDTRWGDPDLPKTVMIARSRDRDDLREAMLARRVYAVAQDYNDLLLDFYIGDQVMGSRLRQPAGTSLPVSVNVRPERSVSGPLRIQLVGPGNEVLEEVSGAALNGSIISGQASSYVFVRVYEGERPIAFSAPIWLQPGASPLPYCRPPEAWEDNSLMSTILPF